MISDVNNDARDEGLAPSPEELFLAAETECDRRRQVASAMRTLTQREREVIRRRYSGAECPTKTKVAAEMSVSKTRACGLEESALSKIRCAIRAKSLPTNGALTIVKTNRRAA